MTQDSAREVREVELRRAWNSPTERSAAGPTHAFKAHRHAAACAEQRGVQRAPPRPSFGRHAACRRIRNFATHMAAAAVDEKPPFYVTTPIYYVNGQPHIGHAYTTLACDVIARFKRLDGHDVKFLTGTDEHGQKVEQSANAAGETPIAFADRVSDVFRGLLDTYDFSTDDFIRTTEPRHRDAVQALWQKLLANGDIYLGAYEGWYSIRDECFYTEDELIDDEKNAGEKVAPTGAPVEWVAESSYFFKLSKYCEPSSNTLTTTPSSSSRWVGRMRSSRL